MIKLILSDLRLHRGAWGWTLVVSATCSTVILGQLMVTRGSRVEATMSGNQMLVEAANSLSAWALIVCGLTAIPVLSSVISFALTNRSRSFALWEAAGLRPRTLSIIVRTQALLVACLGTIISIPAGFAAAAVLSPLLRSELVIGARATPQLALVDIAVTTLCVGIAAWLAAGAMTRQLRKQPLAALLRADAQLAPRPGLLRILVRLVMALAMVAMVTVALVYSTDDPMTRINISIFGSFAALGFFVVGGRFITPAIETFLGTVFPVSGVCWHVATRTCAAQSSRSSATVMPFTIAMALVGILFTIAGSDSSGMTVNGFVAMIGPSLLAAWVGGIAVIAISAARAQTDSALLVASGATVGQVRTITVMQGFIHCTTAALQALCVTALTVAILIHIEEIGYGWKPALGAVPATELTVTFLAAVFSATGALLLSSQHRLSVTGVLSASE